MPGFDLLIAFLTATFLFAYIPGPGMFYTTARTLSGGRRAGWMAALGLHLGGYAHVLAAAFGLAVLFETVPILYLVMKALGALYLIWLGLGMILGRRMPTGSSGQGATERPVAAFWQSVMVEMLNPKTALFFLAFLPQFTDPSASQPIWLQLLVLGTVVNLVFSSGDLICVLAAERMSRLARDAARESTFARRIGGGVLVALGVNLGLSRS